ncbi:membrane-associated phospholipid phosphatase [Actinoplanes octamycinicus]|uniref:Membrane-associated phospholipid phosphatase n=1 Tax=Actinoplanes octamycinicus TaxID=135948 RepID=A0A7W7M9B2_9ACTN|nr:vanadium-dependent haloperoxidase [Actinoplanes octamycinicus]MBB4741767.1 membrane-associated phospholipid phosphatase [Actinoplanes octamycinicus]
MKKLLLVVAVLVAGVGAGAPAVAQSKRPDIDSVRVWNELAFTAVRTTRATDADAARLYAMLDAAMYDAVNGLRSGHARRAPALVGGSGPHGADPQAAAASAAHAVLVRADADRTATYDAQLAADLAKLGPGTPVDRGAAWGDQVGAAVIASRADDGYRPVESQAAGAGPGVFRAEWSGTQYRHVRPFAVANPARYVPGAPPALTSTVYAQAFAQVKTLGNAAIPAPDLLATFQFWSLPAGSVQPPGEWLRIALTVAGDRHLPLAEQTRLTALLTMTLADTTVVTVSTKYAYRHWRPTTAIREADTDGNPATEPDPAWTSRAGSVGGSPEYVSGHSSYSGAAATVLAGFFRTDRIPFTHTTDSAPGGVARSYPGFAAAATEVGLSRVYGGQHFSFSDQAGQTIGRGVAREVLTTSLLPA